MRLQPWITPPPLSAALASSLNPRPTLLSGLRRALARKAYALAPDGTLAREVKTVAAKGALTFTVSPEDRTLHYELVAP